MPPAPRTRITDARHALRAFVEDAKRSGYKCPIQAPPTPPPRIKDRVSHARRKPDGGRDKPERPRNAFFMFRSEMRHARLFPESFPAFSKENNISCLAAIIWRALSADEKGPWHRLADQEKRALGFAVSSNSTAVKGEYEEPKSEPEMWIIEVAKLLLQGYQGEDLTRLTKAVMRRHSIGEAISFTATTTTRRGVSNSAETNARRSEPYTPPRIERELVTPEPVSPASQDVPTTPYSSPYATSPPSLSNTPTTPSQSSRASSPSIKIETLSTPSTRFDPPSESRVFTPAEHSLEQGGFFSGPPFIDYPPSSYSTRPANTDAIDFYDYNHINDAYLRTKHNSQLACLSARFDTLFSLPQFKEYPIPRFPSPIMKREEQILCINPLLTIGTPGHH